MNGPTIVFPLFVGHVNLLYDTPRRWPIMVLVDRSSGLIRAAPCCQEPGDPLSVGLRLHDRSTMLKKQDAAIGCPLGRNVNRSPCGRSKNATPERPRQSRGIRPAIWLPLWRT